MSTRAKLLGAGPGSGRGCRISHAPGCRGAVAVQVTCSGGSSTHCPYPLLSSGHREEEKSPWQPRTDVTMTCNQPARFGAERGTRVPNGLQIICKETCLLPSMQGRVTYSCPHFTAGNLGKVTSGIEGWIPTSNPQPRFPAQPGCWGCPLPHGFDRQVVRRRVGCAVNYAEFLQVGASFLG